MVTKSFSRIRKFCNQESRELGGTTVFQTMWEGGILAHLSQNCWKLKFQVRIIEINQIQRKKEHPIRTTHPLYITNFRRFSNVTDFKNLQLSAFNELLYTVHPRYIYVYFIILANREVELSKGATKRLITFWVINQSTMNTCFFVHFAS